MDEGTAQAAAAGEATERLLQALRLGWGEHYLIGHNPEIGWWAARHGRVGCLLTAGGPEELRAAMAGDYGPVKP